MTQEEMVYVLEKNWYHSYEVVNFYRRRAGRRNEDCLNQILIKVK